MIEVELAAPLQEKEGRIPTEGECLGVVHRTYTRRDCRTQPASAATTPKQSVLRRAHSMPCSAAATILPWRPRKARRRQPLPRLTRSSWIPELTWEALRTGRRRQDGEESEDPVTCISHTVLHSISNKEDGISNDMDAVPNIVDEDPNEVNRA